MDFRDVFHSSVSVSSGFLRGKDWQRALQVLIDLRGNGAANDVSYGAAISACESSEEWQTAIVLLTEACLVSSTRRWYCFFVFSLHGTRCSMYGLRIIVNCPGKYTIYWMLWEYLTL